MRIRNTRPADAPHIVQLQRLAFPSFDPESGLWKEEHVHEHLRRFPEGQFVAVDDDGSVIGSATTLRVPKADVLRPHRWHEATGGPFLRRHVPDGDVLYAADVCVSPLARRKGVGRALYQARRHLARKVRVDGIVSGGRIPGYGEVADLVTAEEYVASVVRGERRDRVLSFQLANGFTVVGVLPNYLRDPPSRDYASHIVWWNPQGLRLRRPEPSRSGVRVARWQREVKS